MQHISEPPRAKNRSRQRRKSSLAVKILTKFQVNIVETWPHERRLHGRIVWTATIAWAWANGDDCLDTSHLTILLHNLVLYSKQGEASNRQGKDGTTNVRSQVAMAFFVPLVIDGKGMEGLRLCKKLSIAKRRFASIEHAH